jgi:putative ABC transport system permease protein
MISQILAVTGMSLRSLPARWGSSLVVVVSLAGVVGVMVAILAMAEGFDKTFAGAGREDRVIVLRSGVNSETTSYITREEVQTLLAAPGLATDADGEPLASIERFRITAIPKKATGTDANVVMRGVTERALKIRPEMRIVQGRWFEPGLRELVVGRPAQSEFAGLDLGARVMLGATDWTVVGVFESGGGVHESELWGDLETVMSAFNHTVFSSITAQLESAASFQAYKDAVTTNPSLNHEPQRENEYYAAQSETLSGLMRTLGYTVAVIMALGALFSAVNTLYAAVKARSVEIATLRAIGFSALPVVISVLLEALVLTAIGGVIGGALAWGLFNGYTVATLNGQTFSQVAFAFHVSGALFVQGIVWSCVIGFVGALLPAVRAARLPVAEALRAA